MAEEEPKGQEGFDLESLPDDFKNDDFAEELIQGMQNENIISTTKDGKPMTPQAVKALLYCLDVQSGRKKDNGFTRQEREVSKQQIIQDAAEISRTGTIADDREGKLNHYASSWEWAEEQSKLEYERETDETNERLQHGEEGERTTRWGEKY